MTLQRTTNMIRRLACFRLQWISMSDMFNLMITRATRLRKMTTMMMMILKKVFRMLKMTHLKLVIWSTNRKLINI
jgi:hypothetical protein